MLELLMCKKKSGSVPGGNQLIGYYQTPNNPARYTGYYGLVDPADFITSTALRSALNPPGISTPASMTTNFKWMKFLLDGKILFVATTTVVYSSNPDQLNGAGLMNGSRQISVLNMPYKIRVLKTLIGDSGSSIPIGNEWDRLLSNVSDKTGLARQEGDKWAALTPTQLGFDQGNGSFSICPEIKDNQIWMRGYNAVDNGGGVFSNQSSSYNLMGWRPVLELVQ